jgi:hypothetical protein
MMKIYVFGNQDSDIDNIAINTVDKIRSLFPEVNFIITDPIDGFEPNEREITLIDTAVGIPDIVVFDDINKIELSPRVGLHDYDLSFNLKLLKKLGKIDKVQIIAIPSDYQLDKAAAKLTEILKSM